MKRRGRKPLAQRIEENLVAKEQKRPRQPSGTFIIVLRRPAYLERLERLVNS